MAMRAVEGNWYRNMLFHLGNTKARYDTAISQTTSGKKLNNLSDNPADMAHVLNLRGKIDQIDQFDRNIESGRSFLKTSESALNRIQNAIYSVITIAEQGASDSTDAQGRDLLATRLDEIRDEIMDYANTEIMGKHVFSGTATDTVPFTKAADTFIDPPGIWEPGDITYNGNDQDIDVQVEFALTKTTNIPGNTVFGTGAAVDIFDRLQDMVYDLRNDDTLAVGGAIGTMNEVVDQISNSLGSIGNRVSHLTQIQGQLKSFKTSILSKMSQLEDADMAEAIANLGREEIALQATLQSGAKIQRYSLMNYLG